MPKAAPMKSTSKSKSKSKATAPKRPTKKAKQDDAEPESFAPRELVLAKLKGFPLWPAMIIEPKHTPIAIRAMQPVGRKKPAYAVRFFPKGDYLWLSGSVLTRLTTERIVEYQSACADLEAQTAEKQSETKGKKKGEGIGRKDLMEAYEAANNLAEWEKEHEAALKAVKKEEAKKRKKEKAAEEEVDELEEDEPAKTGQKRARAAPKKAAAPKTQGKAAPKAAGSAKSKKAPAADATSKSKSKKTTSKAPPKTKRKVAPKSKATVESEDDAGAAPEEEDEDEVAEEEEDGPPKKKARTAAGAAGKAKPKGGAKAASKGGAKKAAATAQVNGKDDDKNDLENDPDARQVRDWRNKLQKCFLKQSEVPPKESEMPAMDTLFTQVENYEEMSVEYLTFSKIGKVMRHIHLLEPARVPRDDEYNFRDRAKVLVDKWNGMLSVERSAEGASTGTGGGAQERDGDGEGVGVGEGELTMLVDQEE
ncbi:PWWP domain-containing protein [Mycena chlorophos]|uniref:PWWP domain-containing protein n=1 Tax=Mycena chlorophos TaxID=658473 RepID=A0A8H6RX60_MYCCL|nr:PWWP domain-containing protein [Mycena chlorophos]